MISEQTTGRAPVSITAATMRRPFGQIQLTALSCVARRVTGVLRKWAGAPVLPYASLWEASVLLDVLTEREYFEPDRYTAEAPFVTDSWPRG